MVVSRRDIRRQRTQRVERSFVRELELKIHILFDQVHRHVAWTFDHDLAVALPGNLRQFSQRRQFSELRFVIRIRNRTWTKPVAEAERNVISLHDLADFLEVCVEEIFLVMRKAPLRENGSTAADDSRSAFHSQRDITQQDAGVDRKVIDTLLGLLDQRVAIHFPREFFRTASGLLERLVYRNGSDRDRRISKNPLACFMNVTAG